MDPATAAMLAAAAERMMGSPGAGGGGGDEQRAALQYCEAIMEKPSCVQYGLHFAMHANGYSPVVRYFGLQLLEHAVKFHWNNLSQDEKMFFKTQLVAQFMLHGVRPLTQEPSYIRQRASVVLAEICKREWPQRWTSLLDDLFHICNTGAVQVEMVLVFLRVLVEDVLNFDADMPSDRRQEIRAGVTECLPALLSFFSNVLMQNVPPYRVMLQQQQQQQQQDQQQAKAALLAQGRSGTLSMAAINAAAALASSTSARNENMLVHEALISACLETLMRFLGWIEFKDIYNTQLLPMLCELLHSQAHRLIACDCLFTVLERKGQKEERVPLLSLFENLQSVTSSLPPVAEGPDAEVDEAEYLFAQHLCDVLVVIGTNQLCALWGPQGCLKDPPAHFEDYLMAVYNLSAHPSLHLCALTLPLWLQLLRHDTARQHPALLRFCEPLLDLAARRLGRHGDPTNGFVGPSAPYNEIDFTTDEEFEFFFAATRGNFIALLRQISSIDANACLTKVMQAFAALLQRPLRPGHDLDPAGALLPASEGFAAWDTAACYIESVLRGAFASLDQLHQTMGLGMAGTPVRTTYTASLNADTQTMLRQALATVLELRTADPSLLLFQLGLLEAFLPVLQYEPFLDACLELLFLLMTFRAAEDHQNMQDTAETQGQFVTGLSDGAKVRRKAGAVLVGLCEKPPASLLSSLPGVIARVQEMMALPYVTELQKRLLIQALMAAGNMLPGIDEHAAFIDSLLGSVAVKWSSPEAAALLSDPQQLALYGGLTDVANPNYANRSELTNFAMGMALGLSTTRSRQPDSGSLASAHGSVTDIFAASGGGGGGGSLSVHNSPKGKSLGNGGGSTNGAAAGNGGNGTNGGRRSSEISTSTAARLSGAGGCAAGGDGLAHPCAAQTRAILPNVLLLIRSLHNLWTPASTTILPPPFRAMLDFRRADICAQLTSLGYTRAGNMTAEEWFIDRAQLWLNSLREACYHIFSQACRQGVLYEMPEWSSACLSTVFAGLEWMHKRHMRMLVRHVVGPLLQYAPRNPALVPQLTQPLVRAYSFFHGFLAAEWERLHRAAASATGGGNGGAGAGGVSGGSRNSSSAAAGGGGANGVDPSVNGPAGAGPRGSLGGAGSAGGGSGSAAAEGVFRGEGESEDIGNELREILHDKLSRELTQDVIVHLLHVFADVHQDAIALAASAASRNPATGASSAEAAASTSAARSVAARSRGAAGRGGDKAGDKEAHPHHFGPNALFILSTGELAGVTLVLLCQALTCPISAACEQACGLFVSILPVLAEAQPLQPFVAGQLFEAGLSALSLHGQHADCEAKLLKMLCFIYSTFGEPNSLPFLTLLRVPGVTEQQLRNEEKTLRQKMPKAQRVAFRKLVTSIIGVNIGQALRARVEIRSLPEKLQLSRPQPVEEDEPPLELSKLFDS